ncbi:glycosyl hydrolase 115 family protein, partial [Balneolaceae bacterium ANBcel3]|nr:glycosyl hydrolase 115 family protein [Balneolaceae bacterium ANBcel3]
RKHAQDTSKIVEYWALYKEVQEYYEMGMTVPDDVMILLANDNWGNIRLLPDPETAHEREGGWGMYYHFDYVGGPRTYKWINTTQISRIWEQMGLTWNHGVNRLWLVNVGDMKPHELPVSFFLDYAWNPEDMPRDVMDQYPVNWAKQQFGAKYAEEIGRILTEYTRINSRRKPELLDQNTYSLHNFREAERVMQEWEELREITARVKAGLPEKYYDAFYQLVEYKVDAASSLHEMYMAAAKNRAYARQVRNTTNEMADRVRELFDRADEIREKYHSIADGKWRHQADQTYIGYTSWAQPYADRMPFVYIIHTPYDRGAMAISAENSLLPWPGPFSYPGPGPDDEPKLPVFDKYNQQTYYFEVFNQGSEPFEYDIEVDAPWVQLSGATGSIKTQEKVWVSIDWDSVPAGTQTATISVTGPNAEWGEHTAEIKVEAFNPASPSRDEIRGFVESNGYVSIEAENYTRNITKEDLQWKKIPQLGRTKSAMSPYPVVVEVQKPGRPDTPRLEYDMHIFNPGEVTVRVYLSPTKNYSKNFRNLDGIRYALSFNEDEPIVVNMHNEMPAGGGFSNNVWYGWTSNNIIVNETSMKISEEGLNTLKLWLVDTGLAVQKIVIMTDEIGATYLGPPQSFINE